MIVDRFGANLTHLIVSQSKLRRRKCIIAIIVAVVLLIIIGIIIWQTR